MKPTCFSCKATMKVVYVRVNQVCVKIKDYYHCDYCNRTKRVVEQDIQLGNIIAKNGILSLLPKSIKLPERIKYSLNLRIHQYKLDFWVNDRKKDTIEMCRPFILTQAGSEKYRDYIKQDSWKIEFKDNGLVNIVLTDGDTILNYLKVKLYRV